MPLSEAPGGWLEGGLAALLWTREGQAPIVLLDCQVLFFNHGAAPTLSIAIIQLPESCFQSGRPKELLNIIVCDLIVDTGEEGW